MQRITRAASLLFFLALLPTAALADSAPVCVPGAGQGGILTGLAHQFSTTTQPWMATALHYAQGLFFALVAIEIAWSAITYVLQKDSLPDFVASLLLKILGVGFFFIVLQPQYGPVWIGDIISSFSQAGSAISGQVQLTPSDPSSIFNCGTDIANAMLESASENQGMTLGNLLPMIEIVLTAMICALGVVLAFAIIAGQLLITLVESYIVIGAGVFMLGFTGSRWTLVFGEKYVGYAVSIGIKLFMLELIVGLGFDLGQQWGSLFANGIAPPETYIEVVGAALVFGFLAWQIPSLAASLMNGAPRMTLGSFVSTAGAVAVGGVIVGSGVGALAAGATTLAGGSSEAARAAGDVGDVESAHILDTGGRGDGRGDVGSTYDPDAYSRDSDTFASSASSERDNEIADAADEVSESGDSAESAVTEEELATSRASDAAVAADAAREVTQAEESDVRSDPTRAPRGINPMLFRQPPVPDDSADGNVEVRFKHPE
ncbi:MAG TPA: P-type conjugative transfer protein TrbL [Candidatus Binatia bacterium]|nr:P-type conjugative transfer protein TrbL [Candidatus Binatia bacterium]